MLTGLANTWQPLPRYHQSPGFYPVRNTWLLLWPSPEEFEGPPQPDSSHQSKFPCQAQSQVLVGRTPPGSAPAPLVLGPGPTSPVWTTALPCVSSNFLNAQHTYPTLLGLLHCAPGHRNTLFSPHSEGRCCIKRGWAYRRPADETLGMDMSPKTQDQGQCWDHVGWYLSAFLRFSSFENLDIQEAVRRQDAERPRAAGEAPPRHGPNCAQPFPGPGKRLCTPVSFPSTVVSGHTGMWRRQEVLSQAARGSPHPCLRSPPCWFYTFTFTTAKCFLWGSLKSGNHCKHFFP